MFQLKKTVNINFDMYLFISDPAKRMNGGYGNFALLYLLYATIRFATSTLGWF